MDMLRSDSSAQDQPAFNVSLNTEEARFLEYRLEVIRYWPESERKQAVLEGIALRLRSLGLP